MINHFRQKMLSQASLKKIIVLILFFALITAVLNLLIFFDPLRKSQLYLSNFLYKERQSQNPIIIVAIDNESLNKDIGLGEYKDWRRNYFARVIENLQKHNPAAIGIDVYFDSPSKGISQEDVDKITASPSSAFTEMLKYNSNVSDHPDDILLLQEIKKHDNLVFFGKFEDIDQKTLFRGPFFSSGIDAKVGNGIIFPDSLGLIRSIDNTKKGVNSFALETIKASGKKYSLPDERKNKMLINYSTKTLMNLDEWKNNKNLHIIPFSRVYFENYADTISPELFKNKIILIGAYDTVLGDNHLTPIDTKNSMPGVQIHAQAIQTILDGAWLREMSKTETTVISILFIVISAILIFLFNIKISLFGIILLGAFYIMSARYFFNSGLIINLIYPPLTLLFSMITGYAFRFVIENSQKNLLRTAFGKYVNKGMAEAILSNSDALELKGEKREITVLFSDIKSFTAISEKLSPQSLVELLNEYFEAMARVIVGHGGTIDKYEGDAIMAFFGAPSFDKNHAIRACHAAIDMRSALKILLEKWEMDKFLSGGEKKPKLDFRVGISTGEAIVGNIGSSEKIQYTAIGDTINLGSRLESANKKYSTSIMISEKTAHGIDDLFELRFVDIIKVKGKTVSEKVFELLSLKGMLPKKQIEFNQKYHAAVQLYFERKFIEALNSFNELLKENPKDALSNIYASRCEILKRYPPGVNWDFVYSMETK